jgi:hypothetical protein
MKPVWRVGGENGAVHVTPREYYGLHNWKEALKDEEQCITVECRQLRNSIPRSSAKDVSFGSLMPRVDDIQGSWHPPQRAVLTPSSTGSAAMRTPEPEQAPRHAPERYLHCLGHRALHAMQGTGLSHTLPGTVAAVVSDGTQGRWS